MTGDTVECFNCGRANPSWAQVCRSCGVPIKAVAARSGPQPAIPTDQDSLVSIGAAVGSIIVAIGVGLLLSGIIPDAPPILEPAASVEPSGTPRASPSFIPSSGPPGESAAPVALPGTVTFGLGLNQTTREVVNPTDTFGPGQVFAHSIALPGPFGVSEIQEEVIRIEADGATLTVMQPREGSDLPVNADAQIAGFSVNTNGLISGPGSWGPGNYILRAYRGVELIAEGRFTLTN
ncbi:MAG TPA: zinc ribbon domain-containing protein [Candidatus Dormibacteraeota bacterium]|nr:zinc ribbon domain-containing protein [Candidatus Dormibacteraeota bacterium]